MNKKQIFNENKMQTQINDAIDRDIASRISEFFINPIALYKYII